MIQHLQIRMDDFVVEMRLLFVQLVQVTVELRNYLSIKVNQLTEFLLQHTTQIFINFVLNFVLFNWRRRFLFGFK
jgi:hypothetical protein